MWCVDGPPETAAQSKNDIRESEYCFVQNPWDEPEDAWDFANRLKNMPDLKLDGYSIFTRYHSFENLRKVTAHASPDGRHCPDDTWKPANICSGVDKHHCVNQNGVETGKCDYKFGEQRGPIASAKSFEESKKSKGGAMKNATADVLSMGSQVDAAPDQVLRVSHGTYSSCEHVKTAGDCEHELAQQGCPVTCNNAKGVNRAAAIKAVYASGWGGSWDFGKDPHWNLLAKEAAEADAKARGYSSVQAMLDADAAKAGFASAQNKADADAKREGYASAAAKAKAEEKAEEDARARGARSSEFPAIDCTNGPVIRPFRKTACCPSPAGC